MYFGEERGPMGKTHTNKNQTVAGGLNSDYGIYLSVLHGITEFDKWHYFPYFTVILFCT